MVYQKKYWDLIVLILWDSLRMCMFHIMVGVGPPCVLGSCHPFVWWWHLHCGAEGPPCHIQHNHPQRRIPICFRNQNLDGGPHGGHHQFFKPESMLLKVGSNITIFIGKVGSSKKRHSYNFLFQASILNQRGPNRYVLRLIQWQNPKRKIVAVSFFCDTA